MSQIPDFELKLETTRLDFVTEIPESSNEMNVDEMKSIRLKKVNQRDAQHCWMIPFSIWTRGLTLSAIALSLVAQVTLSGCGKTSEIPRFKLSGEATYDGKPIPYGEMIIAPDVDKSNHGPSSVITIRDGHFQTEKSLGHIGGPYLVLITGFDGQAPANPDPLNTSMKGKVIFENYRTSLDLPKSDSTQSIEVPLKKQKS